MKLFKEVTEFFGEAMKPEAAKLGGAAAIGGGGIALAEVARMVSVWLQNGVYLLTIISLAVGVWIALSKERDRRKQKNSTPSADTEHVRKP